MNAPQSYQMVATTESAEIIGRLTQETAQAIAQALTGLARFRDDAAARGDRHGLVPGFRSESTSLSQAERRRPTKQELSGCDRTSAKVEGWMGDFA